MLLWVLASKLDNKIPNDPKWIKEQLHIGKADLQPLMDKGFISLLPSGEVAIADCEQNAIPETEAETEKRQRRKEKEYTESFENFWKIFKGRWDKDGAGSYGSYSKGSKAEAFKIWEKLTATEQQKATKGAPDSAGKYTPDCYRWLREKRWEK